MMETNSLDNITIGIGRQTTHTDDAVASSTNHHGGLPLRILLFRCANTMDPLSIDSDCLLSGYNHIITF